MKTYEPDQDTKDKLANEVRPLTADLNNYKDQLGDGTSLYRGLQTGFVDVDNLISGLDRFILLAGRSGAGKTTLAIQLALGVAKHTPIIIYSFEMGKYEIITKIIQVTAKGLYGNDIELRGNDPDLKADTAKLLADTLTNLETMGNNIYIKDASNGIPSILPNSKDKRPSVYDDVEQIKKLHKTDKVLVVIDSVQDIVRTDNANQVQAEVQTIQDLTTLQQKSGATILATAQKNKGSINSLDSYGDVMGSMSFIHKPNTVIELITAKELLAKNKGSNGNQDIEADIEADAKDGHAKPMYLNVIKGRYTGTNAIPLKYYGAYGYYESGENNRYADVYKMFK